MNVNAGAAIQPEKLGETLADSIMNWSEGQEEEFFKAIDEAAEKCNTTAQSYLSRGHGIKTGSYRDHFAVSSRMESKHHKVADWYVDDPEYRLTHLLENGHAKRNGGRTAAVKHIAHGKAIAEQVLEERLNSLWQG